MKVGPPVRAADHGDHEVGLFPDLLITDGRFQHVLVLIDPFREVESLQASTHLPFSRAVVEYIISLT
jgi:hypothetical protein